MLSTSSQSEFDMASFSFACFSNASCASIAAKHTRYASNHFGLAAGFWSCLLVLSCQAALRCFRGRLSGLKAEEKQEEQGQDDPAKNEKNGKDMNKWWKSCVRISATHLLEGPCVQYWQQTSLECAQYFRRPYSVLASR